MAQTASAEYIINNFLSPVYFYDAIKRIPENAVVVEVSSHALFQSILSRSLPNSCTCIGLMKRNAEDNVMRFMKSIGTLFQLGFNPEIAKLYPNVDFPIIGGSSISPLVKWKHDEKYSLMDYVNVIEIELLSRLNANMYVHGITTILLYKEIQRWRAFYRNRIDR